MDTNADVKEEVSRILLSHLTKNNDQEKKRNNDHEFKRSSDQDYQKSNDKEYKRRSGERGSAYPYDKSGTKHSFDKSEEQEPHDISGMGRVHYPLTNVVSLKHITSVTEVQVYYKDDGRIALKVRRSTVAVALATSRCSLKQ